MPTLKTREVVITAEGGDKGKKFVITRMSALKAERWARHGLAALAKGADIPSGDIEQHGMAAWASMGLKAVAHIPEAEADKLLDELMACVQIVTAEKPLLMRPLILESSTGDDDVDEVQTIIKLRWEAFDLHTGFSTTAAPFLGQMMDSLKRMAAAASSISSTSPEPSE